MLARQASFNNVNRLAMECQPVLCRRTTVQYTATPQLSIPAVEQDAPVMIETAESPFCSKALKCGHACKGLANESKCTVPCLEAECAKEGRPTGDDLCAICYCSELSSDPCAKLSCGHIFHAECLVQLLEHGCPTVRLTFAFMSCPECKAPIDSFDCEPVAKALRPLVKLQHKVNKMALKHAQEEGILEDERLKTVGDFYYQKPLEYALHRCSIYKCHKCSEPFFGGLIDCEMENSSEKKAEDMICKPCLVKDLGSGQTTCEKHGDKHIDWKCMFCCSIALYMCHGTHFFCNPCHDEYNRVWGRAKEMKRTDCHGVDCPLGVAHPAPHWDPRKGGVFPLGCNLCRSEKLDLLEQARGDVHLNRPKWCNRLGAKEAEIVRPAIEIEMPDFIVEADEIEAKRQRYIGFRYLTPAQLKKKARREARKAAEIAAAEEEAKRQRYIGFRYLTPAQLKKKARRDAKKAEKLAAAQEQ